MPPASAPAPAPRPASARPWWAFLALLAAIYAVVAWRFHGLAFPLDRDELHFWPTSLGFSHGLSWAGLRDYPELNTPLAYVLFGGFQRLTAHGLVVSRWFNLLLSAAVVIFIAAQGALRRRAMLAGLGLLVCPYYLAVATHVYSDTLALALVVAGVWLQRKRRWAWAAAAFALAIAARQTMVAFPAALAAEAWWNDHPPAAWLWPAAAAATLAGWVIFFGGLSPQTPFGGGDAAPHLFVRNALVLLVCVGAYFVLPEAVLLGRTGFKFSSARTPCLLAGGLLALFWFFPPLANTLGSPVIPGFGFLDRALRALAPDPVRLALFFLLAAAAVLRFGSPARKTAAWLIAANAALMMLAPVAWEKYALPLLAVLWLLEADPLAE